MRDVAVYGLPHCNMCKMIKSKLEAKGIAFTYTDDESETMKVSAECGLTSAPIIKINGNYYTAIDAAKQLGL